MRNKNKSALISPVMPAEIRFTNADTPKLAHDIDHQPLVALGQCVPRVHIAPIHARRRLALLLDGGRGGQLLQSLLRRRPG